MSRDYPVPSYAANIWIKGDQIWLGFDGHSTPFPASQNGLAMLLATLRERTRGKVLIGQNGAPTRYQVERTLQRDKRWNDMLQLMRASAEKAATQSAMTNAEMDELLKDLL